MKYNKKVKIILKKRGVTQELWRREEEKLADVVGYNATEVRVNGAIVQPPYTRTLRDFGIKHDDILEVQDA